jgi:hypothetical protein
MNPFARSFLTLAILIATPAFAAKFRPTEKMKSTAAQGLEKVATEVVKHKSTFGDAGMVTAYTFTRDESEADLNTAKQLNSQKGGFNSDDLRAEDMSKESAASLADYILSANSQPDDQAAYDTAHQNLERALNLVKRDSTLKIFGASHADEDGGWQILDIVDLNSKQVLFIKVGMNGT